MIQDRLSADTDTVLIKGIFGVYLECYWGVYYYKMERQALNTGQSFVF